MQLFRLLKAVTKKFGKRVAAVFYFCSRQPRPQQRRYHALIKKSLFCAALLLWNIYAYADDILKGTETTLVDTLNGTGKKYLYIAEGLISLLMYIKTKNIVVLIGIMVVAIFFNIMLKIAGVAT